MSRHRHVPITNDTSHTMSANHVLPPEVAQITAKALVTTNIVIATIVPTKVLELILKLIDQLSTFSRTYERELGGYCSLSHIGVAYLKKFHRLIIGRPCMRTLRLESSILDADCDKPKFRRGIP